MQRLVNSTYVIRPDELTPGDVMVAVVTLHITERGFRMYRCTYPPPEYKGIPQGSRLGEREKEVATMLFPVAIWADLEPDL